MLLEFGFVHSIERSSVPHLASRCLLILQHCTGGGGVICYVAQKFERNISVAHPHVLRFRGLYCCGAIFKIGV